MSPNRLADPVRARWYANLWLLRSLESVLHLRHSHIGRPRRPFVGQRAASSLARQLPARCSIFLFLVVSCSAALCNVLRLTSVEFLAYDGFHSTQLGVVVVLPGLFRVYGVRFHAKWAERGCMRLARSVLVDCDSRPPFTASMPAELSSLSTNPADQKNPFQPRILGIAQCSMA